MYLVADYIFADEALCTLVSFMKEGYSGITSGNFLVIEESFRELPNVAMKKDNEAISLHRYQLLAYAFKHMHPISLGHSINMSNAHTVHANRLFWRVNPEVMIGRFYLRHMLCIKPEISDYVIGSACDYSFIDELCPSGRVKHLSDSDECCYVEMAPYDYDQHALKEGKLTPEVLAESLSEWTTAPHRANAHFPMIFHSAPVEIPPLAILQQSAEFIQNVEQLLSPTPHPVRGHPYWLSCLDDTLHYVLKHEDQTRFIFGQTIVGLIGSPTFFPEFRKRKDDHLLLEFQLPPLPYKISRKEKKKQKLRRFFTGGLFDTDFPWVQWFDVYKIRKTFKRRSSSSLATALIFFQHLEGVLDGISNSTETCYLKAERLTRRSEEELSSLLTGKKQAILTAQSLSFSALSKAVHTCAPYLPEGCLISIVVMFEKPLAQKNIKNQIPRFFATLETAGIACEALELNCNFYKMYFGKIYTFLAKWLLGNRQALLKRICGGIGLTLLNVLAIVNRALSLAGAKKKRSTSMVLELRVRERK